MCSSDLTLGAGGAGQIRGAAVHGLVGQHGENECFLGVAGQAQVFCRHDFNFAQGGGELREDERIAGAAAGDEQLRNGRPC